MSNEGDDDEFDDIDDVAMLQAVATFQDDEALLEKLPPLLRESLLPFQKDGVLFGLRRNGCCLLADEMGLGKTIQAISIAAVYSDDWPMLIVVPSSMKYVWLEEIQRWLPQLTPSEIHLVSCSEDVPNLVKCKISIVSYGLFQYKRFFALLENLNITFKVIICDEAHYLKNWKSSRTKHLVKLLNEAKRRILLTGTPALARPEELFTQINSIKPGYFGTYTNYCEKYCQGHYSYRYRRFDVSGASNLDELHFHLTKHIMIRRLKCNVLSELPAKQRQKISFDIPASAMKEVEKVKLKLEELKRKDDNTDFELNKCVMELYKETGFAKIPACVEYIKEMLKQGNKFLVFAHHIAMLDAIERELIAAKTDYIRIDGSVSSILRQEYVRRFQSVDTCLVALLGIQAAGVGLTLTAASLVVFCELHWSPGVLHQAEDRAHRISQKNAVNIYYLIGLGTIDEMLWKKLNRKVDVVGKTLEGQGGDMNTDEADNEDLKSVLASCTTGSPVKRNSNKSKRTKKCSPAKKQSSAATLSYCPGQTKLTSFLNLSVDEDFTDTRVSRPRCRPSTSRVDEILSQAQDKRDKMLMSVFERDFKKRRRIEEKSSDLSKKKCRTSKYFKETKNVINIDSSSSSSEEDEKCGMNVKRTAMCDKDRTSSSNENGSSEKVAKILVERVCHTNNNSLDNPAVIIIDDSSRTSSEDNSQNVPDITEDSSQPVSSCDSGIDPDQESTPTDSPVTESDSMATDGDSVTTEGNSLTTECKPLTTEGDSLSTCDEDSCCSSVDLFTDQPTDTLQFSVSAYTERVYIYDYTGIYLEVNCPLQDILDGTPLPEYLAANPKHLASAQSFAQHWTSISKTTQSQLHNKVISDIDEELKKMYDNRVVSSTRHVRGPTKVSPDEGTAGSTDIHQKVVKRTFNIGKKKVEIEQSFAKNGDPLCMSCGALVVKLTSQKSSKNRLSKLDTASNYELSKLPFQGRFCSLDCSKKYGVKANSHFVRKILFDLELGVCQHCDLDTNQLMRQLKLASPEERIKLINSTILKSLTEKQKRNIVEHPTEGLLWQADHIVPVAEGGGECDIDNYRTLCSVCHKVETKKLLSRLAVLKTTESNKNKGILDIRQFMG